MQAVRGVIWFALAVAAILPVALDGVLTRADVAAPKVNRVISLAALAGLALALLVFVARPSSWFVSEWPEAQVDAVREATRDPDVRLWATDRTADWLLWRIPDLRGRLAYDPRFELYGQEALDQIVQVNARHGDWRAVLEGYDLAVVEGPRRSRTAVALVQRGASVVYTDDTVTLVSLPSAF